MTIQVERGKRGDLKITGSYRDTPRVRRLPGVRAKSARVGNNATVAEWSLPNHHAHLYRIQRELGEGVEYSLPVQRDIESARRTRGIVAKIRRGIEESPNQVDKRLTEHQAVSARWMIHQKRGILAHPMGGGKTPITCSAVASILSDHDHAAVLVVTTKSTLHMWADHVREWMPGYVPYIFHGTKRAKVFEEFEAAAGGRRVLITTHALMAKHMPKANYGALPVEEAESLPSLGKGWDAIVVDEAHKVGLDPAAKGVRAFHFSRRLSPVRFALTGTPVNDNPEDLWVLMNWVEPEVFCSKGDFLARYCDTVEGMYKRVVNLGINPEMQDEFQWMIRPWFMRTPKDVLVKDLPERLPEQVITLPLEGKQAQMYRAMLNDAAIKVKGNLLTADDALALARNLSYIAQGCVEVNEDGRVQAITGPSNKMDFLLELAEERNGDPFVVFAESSKVVDYITETLVDKGVKAAKITGKVSTVLRDGTVKAFQDGKLDVIVLTSAGAEGITLTAADLIVMVQESWRTVTNQQVRDRIDRFGQTRRPQVMILHSEGTVDVAKTEAMSAKYIMQEDVLRDGKRLKAWASGQA